MTNVIVARQRNIQVSTNATGGIIQTTVPVTLKGTPTLMTGNANLKVENLTNVISTNEEDGATLVYQANSGNFVVQKVNLGDLDGGTF
jgi:hypothetical protein